MKINDDINKAQGSIERVWSVDYIELANGWKLPYEELLELYGPEGCYEIANRLRQVADDDANNAIIDSLN